MELNFKTVQKLETTVSEEGIRQIVREKIAADYGADQVEVEPSRDGYKITVYQPVTDYQPQPQPKPKKQYRVIDDSVSFGSQRERVLHELRRSITPKEISRGMKPQDKLHWPLAAVAVVNTIHEQGEYLLDDPDGYYRSLVLGTIVPKLGLLSDHERVKLPEKMTKQSRWRILYDLGLSEVSKGEMPPKPDDAFKEPSKPNGKDKSDTKFEQYGIHPDAL